MSDPPKRRLPLAGDDAAKRRLPVLQDGAEDEAQDRPPWHWAALGMVATFLAWLPLAALVNALLRRVLERGPAGAAPVPLLVAANAAAFAIAAFAGGLLVGRFGGRAGLREAIAGGALAAALAWAIALGEGAPAGALGWAAILLVLALIAGGAAAAGGHAGLRLRRRARAG